MWGVKIQFIGEEFYYESIKAKKPVHLCMNPHLPKQYFGGAL